MGPEKVTSRLVWLSRKSIMLAGSLARAVANLLALSRCRDSAILSATGFKPEKVASVSQTPANLSETCPLARATGPASIMDFGLYVTEFGCYMSIAYSRMLGPFNMQSTLIVSAVAQKRTCRIISVGAYRTAAFRWILILRYILQQTTHR